MTRLFATACLPRHRMLKSIDWERQLRLPSLHGLDNELSSFCMLFCSGRATRPKVGSLNLAPSHGEDLLSTSFKIPLYLSKSLIKHNRLRTLFCRSSPILYNCARLSIQATHYFSKVPTTSTPGAILLGRRPRLHMSPKEERRTSIAMASPKENEYC